jgi:hypothetical protein
MAKRSNQRVFNGPHPCLACGDLSSAGTVHAIASYDCASVRFFLCEECDLCYAVTGSFSPVPHVPKARELRMTNKRGEVFAVTWRGDIPLSATVEVAP